MIKVAAFVVTLSVLAACTGESSGKIRMADDASVGMWTSRPAADVIQCIAALTGGTANGASITSPSGARYEVGPALGGNAYPTQVSRFGPEERPEVEVKLTSCIMAPSSPARS